MRLFSTFLLLISLFISLLLPKEISAQEVCVPGELEPEDPNNYVDKETCPPETTCYISRGSTSRCYLPGGTSATPPDPTAGFSTAASSDTCTGLESINFNPTTVEAKKEFAVTGKLENCPNIAAQAIFIDLQNMETGVEKRGVRDVRTDGNGNFSLDKFVIDERGPWKFKFRYNLTSRIIDSPAAVIQVTESSKKAYTCGDQVENDKSICPAECPNARNGDVYKCGDSKSNEVLEDMCKAMGDVKVDVANLPSCYKLNEKIDARKCSNDEASYICADPTLIMCKEDNGSVACGVKQIDPANAGGVPCDPETGRIVEQPPTKAQIGSEVTLGTGIRAIEEKKRTDEVNRRYNEQVNNLPKGIMTAVGCIPTEPKPLIEGLLKYGSFAAGGIAFLIMLLGALQMITAEGNPESIKHAQERFYSAIIGLLLVIFSVLLMQVIGVDILGLPGFGPAK